MIDEKLRKAALLAAKFIGDLPTTKEGEAVYKRLNQALDDLPSKEYLKKMGGRDD